MFQPDLLRGKRILVTGGGTGLGRAISHRFAELGASLVLCGRRGEVLESTAAAIAGETGVPVETAVCDVRSGEAVDAMVERLWATAPIDILINNAAGNFLARTHLLSHRAVDAVLNTVLHGTAYCTIACGKRWIEGGRPGTVLSVLTLSALQGAPFTVPSAMAKAGVLAMTKSLAVEWGRHGIRLVAVAPGPFPTPGAWQQLMPEDRQTAPLARSIPLGRYGEHAELANLCTFLVSDQAGYITGEAVVIDGGKRHLGGAGPSDLLEWTDEQWGKLRS
ncbi:SDR family oxidoreductase [Chelatococcus reniformis]|uniref:Peroxisomal trans-2-enoyl-CoA reductase n=1 Tax=Chelatococcus reniformis TaxID=1494448 RepID=A0A916XLM0_9HYPH|nr:SDR family oxidoreductase [Chelatococcus reniformis]GGC81547.1 oxidoreductase [Chelatococcus reniformis]